MNALPDLALSAVDIKAAWDVKTLQEDKTWVQTLSDEHHQELRLALAQFRKQVSAEGKEGCIKDGTLLPDETNFTLPVLGPLLKQAQQDLEEAYGIVLFRNFPLQDSDEDVRLMFGGLLSYIGTARSQTVRGELLQPVQDEGQAKLDERRGSKHNLGLPIHNDGCDVVGFLCAETPISGGETIIVSAAAVHNALLKGHPEALRCLYRPYENAWQDYMFPEHKNTEATRLPRTWTAPIFSQREGKMSCRYSRFYIDRAQHYKGVKPMAKEQRNALDIFDAYLNDAENWQYRRQFDKGDVLFVNNHVLFHSRTAFIDGEDVKDRRKLYRAWMAVPNSRPLDKSMACFFGNVEAGAARGGVKDEFMVVDRMPLSA
jgi:alpha-ketoglutarate-dependent taurine dioxygenase